MSVIESAIIRHSAGEPPGKLAGRTVPRPSLTNPSKIATQIRARSQPAAIVRVRSYP